MIKKQKNLYINLSHRLYAVSMLHIFTISSDLTFTKFCRYILQCTVKITVRVIMDMVNDEFSKSL